MEKIHIENFGGIEKMDFDFRSINILIGPQGVGKSVTVKLLYFFKRMIREFVMSFEDGLLDDDFEKKIKNTFIGFFPEESWPQGDFFISYHINSLSIAIKKRNHKLSLDYSDDFKEVVNKNKAIYNSELQKIADGRKILSPDIKREIHKKIRERVAEELKLEDTSIYHQCFIPAGRSFFSNIQTSIFSFLRDKMSVDPFLIEFGSFYEDMKHLYNELFSDKKEKDFDNLSSQVLNGRYTREKEKDYLIHKDARKVNLTNASSGQQETLPLIIILKALNNIENAKFTLYIEEPEAHLFPSAQKIITQLLARTFNSEKCNFQIFITTHSPYILSSFNNLIYAGNLSLKHKDKIAEIEKIIPFKEQLHSESFSVYSIQNNKNKFLMDKTNNLISQSSLDAISENILSDFSDLLDIEFGNEKL